MFSAQVLKMTGLDCQYLVVLCPKLLQDLLTDVFCQQVLKMTGLDSQYLVVLCSKLLQALLTDVFLPAGAEDDRAGQPVSGGALPQAAPGSAH
jgi:hypothetical protein